MTEKMGFETTRTLHIEFGNKPCEGYGYRFKSKEELRWANYLELLKMSKEIESWEYEPQTFEFKERYRARKQYTPDFRTVEHGQVKWYEVKCGSTLTQKAVSKLKYMQADFPDEWITLVYPSRPKKENKISRLLDNAAKYANEIIYSGRIFRKLGL